MTDQRSPRSEVGILPERPPIRNTDDLWCWMNTWGDLEKHGYNDAERRIYIRAMRDLYAAMKKAGISHEAVSNESWRRWTGS